MVGKKSSLSSNDALLSQGPNFFGVIAKLAGPASVCSERDGAGPCGDA